nr:immunoglobulin heavy chain junction region [Mus musculus]
CARRYYDYDEGFYFDYW